MDHNASTPEGKATPARETSDSGTGRNPKTGETDAPSWDQVEPLLDELIDLDTSSQSSYLERLSQEDQALAERLLELLAEQP